MTTAVEVAEKGHQLAAWVNFDGTLAMTVGSSYGPDAPPADYSSPNPIRAAYNVDYIIDRGTGDYEIHFENAMSDTNYVVTGVGSAGATQSVRTPTVVDGDTKSTTQLQIRYHRYDGTLSDQSNCFLAIFR